MADTADTLDQDQQASPSLPMPVRPPALPPQAALQPPPPPNPIDQAQQATAAAIRFQGVRGYQNDLQNGVSAAEALTKWAPAMFGSAGTGPLPAVPRAASGIPLPPPPADFRAVKSAQPQMEAPPAFPAQPVKATPAGTVRDVNGQLVRVNPDGSTTALTPPKAGRLGQVDAEQVRSYLTSMREIEKQLREYEAGDSDPQAVKLRKAHAEYQSQVDAIRRGVIEPQGIPMPPPAAPVRQGHGETTIVRPKGQRITGVTTRKTEDGRTAVFDAVTKKFLYYADSKPNSR